MKEETTRRDVMQVGSAVFMSGMMGAACDGIFNSESPALMVGLSGSASASYAGIVSIGIATGTISEANRLGTNLWDSGKSYRGRLPCDR
jgi:hypothetical protein